MKLQLSLPYIYPHIWDEYRYERNGANYMHTVMLTTLDAYIQHMQDCGLPEYNSQEIEGAQEFYDAMHLEANKYINKMNQFKPSDSNQP